MIPPILDIHQPVEDERWKNMASVFHTENEIIYNNNNNNNIDT